MKTAMAALLALASACGSSGKLPDNVYVGGYVVPIDRAFVSCQTVLKQFGFDLEKTEPKMGVIETGSGWVYHRVPTPGVSFRNQARMRLDAAGGGITHVHVGIVYQENENREKPENEQLAEWGQILVDRSKQQEVQSALQKTLSTGR